MLGNRCYQLFQNANQYLQSHPDMALTIEFQDYEAFECSLCAQCCTVPWQVVVSQAYYERWHYYLEQHPSEKLKSAFIVHQPDNQQAHAHLRKQPGTFRCVLLNDDNRCIMHQEFGPQAKPEGCQHYPRMETDMGGIIQGRHTMPSCRSIPLLWEAEPELVYHFVPRTLLSWSSPPTLKVVPGVRMDAWAFNLWLGMMLDNLLRQGSPLEHLVSMNYALLHLSEWNSPWVRENDLAPLRERLALFIKGSPRPLLRLHQQSETRQWIQDFIGTVPLLEPMSEHYGTRELSGHSTFSPKEQTLWWQFVRNYLIRKSIFYPSWTTGQLSLFQEHYVWAILVVCLQMVVLYFRDTSAEKELDMLQLRSAVNLIEARLAQNPGWFKEHEITQMSPEHCMEQLAILLSCDLS